ncbi:similar to Saccharomyces cerevisiae YPR140W TAZ1 Lyso-phosphatidylcholine acyltransferase, required for normal phospholipid content of mitochondrial membranes [Maudiozyma barnettii]|uniref:Tafazzin family protein n=1 Tax=Maudiozyma barnettii TaxID=61262 RepID=A0A8H2VIM9_9SACH|nr:lysophosphatidylcholine acyltransferase [Kazachstania barnettii]CAB4256080.1 similar to Saccharomyces cerevisiae YPR140W TAZ1 Lyso-phosphatidylcholine acyltransferase, required for normal phospholipid content of mitochondrial membranes [Kazachstania barnettii]CAD1784688.1 similar to Saccharomyces cerevisiae YPR140W TAZ1 Lyso-phosphatidylcholine acyltransferase, required for normal phospholipid content of mitochondrial membranes [Kazachstania barnettii]
MSYEDVLHRGDDFLNQYPRRSKAWRFFSYSTSVFVIGVSKLIIKTFYSVKLNNYENLTLARQRSQRENRGLMTVMNHMSTVDDPFIWATLPMSIYTSLSNMRWCLGAHNICFAGRIKSMFFSAGQVLSTERFGAGPFQGAIDASIRLLSADDTIPYAQTSNSNGTVRKYLPPIIREKPSWVHVYPEGFVLQLHPPFQNSMRYFKWGITRMILEATRPPIVLPIFTTGFENILPEDDSKSGFKQFVHSIGTKINVSFGKPLDDTLVNNYREEWNNLVDKYRKPGETDLNDELKFGSEAQDLRSRLASELRSAVSNIRSEQPDLPKEDPRFKNPSWWKRYTQTEGQSDPDVRFIGQNWAIRRLQKFLNIGPTEKVEKTSAIPNNEKEQENNTTLEPKSKSDFNKKNN